MPPRTISAAAMNCRTCPRRFGKSLRLSPALQRTHDPHRRRAPSRFGRMVRHRTRRDVHTIPGDTPCSMCFDELSTPSNWRQVGVIPASRLIEDRQRVMVPTDKRDVYRVAHPHARALARWKGLSPCDRHLWLFGGVLANRTESQSPEAARRDCAPSRKYAALCRRFARPRMRELADIARLGRAIHHTDERPE